MIYLVSGNKNLFCPTKYKQINFSDAIKIIKSLNLIQLDTETSGLDCHTKDLLTLQLGNKENQVVFDWSTLSENEKSQLKTFLEDPNKTIIGWNLAFDLTFLYVQEIYPKNIIDGMIIDKLIFLGYPPTLTLDLYNNQFGYEPILNESGNIKHWELSYSLKSAAKRWCNIDLDKSVRGQIIEKGLTEDVIVYAANDVKYIEDIYNKQYEELTQQDLHRAAKFECEFIKCVAYTKYCGIHLDVQKWKNKMNKDLEEKYAAIEDLNKFVLEQYYNNKLLFKNFVEYAQPDLFGFVKAGYICKINWDSSQQVIPLFETLGINVKTFDKKTKKEKKSIEEKQIAPQADKFPIINMFLRYQGASKLVSTYGENWLKAINPKTNRIHLELHSIGTDTCRMSSGGGIYKLNAQNLPHDEETRACFTAEEGNVWISCDYAGQESAITASTANDKKMIEILSSGGDLHSEVARSCWPDILGQYSDKEIKEKFNKTYRFNAKGVEFGVFYGGDAHTLMANKGFSKEEAERIYNNFMQSFPGIKIYQDYCRKEVMRKGYILMNPILGHRAHIYDEKWMKTMQNKVNDREFMSYYWQMRKESPYCDTVQEVKRFNLRKSSCERQSINYRIQNRGACAFKLASIKFFNWIISNNYQNIVLMCVPAHDEWNLECPKEMAEEVSDILVKCMVAGGKPFCPNVYLGADISVGSHWIH